MSAVDWVLISALLTLVGGLAAFTYVFWREYKKEPLEGGQTSVPEEFDFTLIRQEWKERAQRAEQTVKQQRQEIARLNKPASDCVMDFPEAFEFIKAQHSDKETHHPECSYRTQSMLCDCSILWAEYYRRKCLKHRVSLEQQRARIEALEGGIMQAMRDLNALTGFQYKRAALAPEPDSGPELGKNDLCPRCDGSGKVQSDAPWKDEAEMIECSDCDGTGIQP